MHSVRSGFFFGLQPHGHGVYRTAGDVLIEDFIDCLLAFYRIQSGKNVTNHRDEKFAATTFDSNVTTSQFGCQQGLNLICFQAEYSDLLPVIKNLINIVIVFRHQSRKLGEILPPEIDPRKTQVFQFPFVIAVQEHLILKSECTVTTA